MSSLAQTSENVLRSVVWQWPGSPLAWLGWGAAFLLTAFLVVATYRRDAQDLPAAVRVFLVALRISALVVLAVIALNPQEKTQREAFKPSEVAVLVDTSTSMQQPAEDRDADNPSPPPRSQVIRDLLADSPLIERLRESHTVNVFAFDEELAEQPIRLATTGQGAPEVPEGEDAPPPVEMDWSEVTTPTGAATRLGDAVSRVLAEGDARTLAGVVVLSDGATNQGRDTRPANDAAREDGVKLFAVGVGGTTPPVNVRVSRLLVPTDVQAGDRFDIGVIVQGQGVAGTNAVVEVVRRTDEAGEELIAEETVTMPEDGQLVQIEKDDLRTREGEVEYVARVRLPDGRVLESRDDDNLRSRRVRVFDRPFEVLVFAGGPMRDYRFARNALNRHPSAEVDVYLQTGRPGLSQDAREVLDAFPETREALFKYDVVLAFDPDWSALSEEQLTWLLQWVSDEGGGLVTVAGNVFTPRVASGEDALAPIRTLLPVILEPVRSAAMASRRQTSPFPFDLTDEGRTAEFLELNDDGGESAWDRFTGVFAAYPVSDVKAGATVYATLSDPSAIGTAGPPPLIAEQRYGQGTSLYLGTSELWRLRADDEEWYERLWVKLVRRAAQARSKRGLGRGLLLLDNRDVPLGKPVTIRARVLDEQFRPLTRTDLPVNVTAPDGRPVVPPVVLQQDKTRPAEFVGEFRPAQPGAYRVELPVPDSEEVADGEIRVELPQLEASSFVQDVASLKRLAEDTGGLYLTAAEAEDAIVDALPAAGQTVVVDRTLRELWDTWWMLALLIGLLAVEWTVRKLLTLA